SSPIFKRLSSRRPPVGSDRGRVAFSSVHARERRRKVTNRELCWCSPTMNKIPMTTEGFNRLQEELKRLKSVDRPAIIKAIAEARTHGDLAENAEYHAARERQSFIEGRVAELEDKI